MYVALIWPLFIWQKFSLEVLLDSYLFYLLVVTVPKGVPYLFSRTVAIGWFVTGDLSDTFTEPEPDYESLVNAWASQATLGEPLR